VRALGILCRAPTPGQVKPRLAAALGQFDLILGPAVDGGYYLIGLREPQPDLFVGIPWATTAVLAQTRARAQRLGLRLHLLKPLQDVDTGRDARALGYLNS